MTQVIYVDGVRQLAESEVLVSHASAQDVTWVVEALESGDLKVTRNGFAFDVRPGSPGVVTLLHRRRRT